MSQLFKEIDPRKLEINDLGFLLISFFKLYEFFILRNDYYSDFTEEIIAPIINRLQELSTENTIESFKPYKDNYTAIDGNGFIDAVYYDEDTTVAHQYEYLHLNYKNDSSTWALGHYLIFQSPDGRVFEIFSLNDSDFTTSARFLPSFDINDMSTLSIIVSPITQDWCKKHALRYLKK